jgi:tubulin polyglutamylase TTLL9
MIDGSLKPWLIEVNGGPSMSANTPFDCKLKCGLIDDVLTIVDLEGMLAGN